MESLKTSRKEKVHQRDIKVCTYQTNNRQIIVEGSLLDNRLIDTFHFSGENRPPATIHHLIIRLLIDSKLTIRQVETEMPCTPHTECPETIDSLQALVGIRISRGFTMRIKEMFSKGKGCSHLSELVIAMAPAAIQGFWTAFASEPLPAEMKDTMKLLLVDACWVWRRNGLALKQFGEES